MMDATVPNPDFRDAPATADGSVRVAWVDERGKVRCMPGRCIDVSARRIHLEVPQQVPLQTRVTLSVGRKSIPGPNAVKYLTRCDTKFILVLE
jgi:hypothetical protein